MFIPIIGKNKSHDRKYLKPLCTAVSLPIVPPPVAPPPVAPPPVALPPMAVTLYILYTVALPPVALALPPVALA